MSNFFCFKTALQRISVVSLLCFSVPFCSFSQSIDAFLPKVHPVAPNVSGILKTINVPISKYNGTPNINIPIHTINLKGYQYPIALSYNASGIKLDEESGTVGLGWNIGLTGQIIHEVRGNDDIGTFQSMYFSNKDPEFVDSIPYPTYQTYYKIKYFKLCAKPSEDVSFTSPDIGLYRPMVYQYRSCFTGEIDYWNHMSHDFIQTTYDTEHEPDLYYLNVPGGYSSTFMLKRNGGLLEKKNTDSKIIFSKKFSGPNIYTYWDVTDRDGVKYLFDKEEQVGQQPLQAPATNYINNWRLSEITTLNNEKIKFSYTQKRNVALKNIYGANETQVMKGQVVGQKKRDYLGLRSVEEQRLDKITFPGGKIEVIYSDRIDVEFGQRIDAIKIFAMEDGIYKLMNTVQFQYTYFQSNFNSKGFDAYGEYEINPDWIHKRLKLESFVSNGLKHSFQYNEEQLPKKNLFSKDHWGYFNGKNNDTLIGSEEYTILQFGAFVDRKVEGADREADSLYNQCYILKKITYPTGGSSEYEYETNDYDVIESRKFDFSLTYPGTLSTSIHKTQLGGGLRIKRVILKKDALDTQPLKNSYQYNYYEWLPNPETQQQVLVKRSYGILPSRPSYCTFTLQPSERITYLNTRYATSVSDMNSSSRGLGYSKVVEFNEGADGQVLKTEDFFYNKPDIVYDYNMARIPGLKNGYNSFNGLPLKTIIYKTNNDKTFEKLSIRETNYHFIRRHEAWALKYLSGGSNPTHLDLGEVLNFFYPTLFNDDYNVTKTIDSLYDSKLNQFIVKTNNYFYSPESYTFLDSTVTTGSKGSFLKTEFKYPKSFVQNPLYNSMLQKNMVSPVIEESRFVKGNPLEQTKNEYKSFSGKIYPGSKWHRYGKNDLEKELSLDAYDTVGNVIEATTKNGIPSAFLWGYNGQHLIASATNTNHEDICVLNFEDHIAGQERSDLKVHTGKYSGLVSNLGSDTVSVDNGLFFRKEYNIAKSYTYSGWIYSEGPSPEISLLMYNAKEYGGRILVDKVVGHQIGKWIYVSKTVMVPETVVGLGFRLSNGGGGNVWFDDLRIHPSDARMTTYTYSPSVGITSQIDPKGKTINYIYDESQRLKYVKDGDGNILQSNEYHYK